MEIGKVVQFDLAMALACEREVRRRWRADRLTRRIRDVDADGRRWWVEGRRVLGVRAHHRFVAGVQLIYGRAKIGPAVLMLELFPLEFLDRERGLPVRQPPRESDK